MNKLQQLIIELNMLGMQRQKTLDRLWELERKSQEKRMKLIKLIDSGLEDI